MQERPQIPQVADEQILNQAIAWAQRAGWVVQIADCSVRIVSTDAWRATGAADDWIVQMYAQPAYNATLERPMPLACRVQLIEGRVCATNLYEPSDRKPYLR